MLTKKKRDVIASLVCLGVGGAFSLGSLKYGKIQSGFPSPTFFPFMGGLILMGLSLKELLNTLLRHEEREGDRERFFPQKDSLRRLTLAISALVGYVLLLEVLGFLVTSFLFMVPLLRFIEPQKWKTIVVTAFLTSALSYVLFQVLLNLRLPRGIFGI